MRRNGLTLKDIFISGRVQPLYELSRCAAECFIGRREHGDVISVEHAQLLIEAGVGKSCEELVKTRIFTENIQDASTAVTWTQRLQSTTIIKSCQNIDCIFDARTCSMTWTTPLRAMWFG